MELGVDGMRGKRENVWVAVVGTSVAAVNLEPVGSSNKGPTVVSSCEAVTTGPPKLAPSGFRLFVSATLTMVFPWERLAPSKSRTR